MATSMATRVDKTKMIEMIEDEPSEVNESSGEATPMSESSPVDSGENNIGVTEDSNEVYTAQSEGFAISILEFAIFNSFFKSCFKESVDGVRVTSYGEVDGVGKTHFGGAFDITKGWWFYTDIDGIDNDFMFQTRTFIDQYGQLATHLHVTAKKGIGIGEFNTIFKDIKNKAFNRSEYKGKCLKVKIHKSTFKGIEILDSDDFYTELVLNSTQNKFIDHFVNRVKRGSNARYLFNGEPGTGKTESIRNIIYNLVPEVTFVIPDFTNIEDLTTILEACEIFDKGVIIMDDIDLFLGSRDTGSYTMLLGEFLSFFDGVKKRRISLLASTNDKGLVDKAAERPGRFNFTLDYSFLEPEQIKEVCKIHLPEQWLTEEVYTALTEPINGKKVKITGAFIANLADNVKEMAEDDKDWSIEDTVELIKESYKGFYLSQVNKEGAVGFKLTGKNG